MMDEKWYIMALVAACVVIVILLIRLNVLSKRLSELSLAFDKLNHVDELTGISNRRHFDAVYQTEFKRASRKLSSIAAIKIDMDFFKDYIHLYGYQKGDDCLKQVALVLSKTLKRETDVVCRYSSQTFVVLLPETSTEAALHLAEMLREGVEQVNIAHKGSSVSDYMTVSVGIAATIPDEQHDAVKQADEALLFAKRKRNAVCLYDETHQKWLKSQ